MNPFSDSRKIKSLAPEELKQLLTLMTLPGPKYEEVGELFQVSERSIIRLKNEINANLWSIEGIRPGFMNALWERALKRQKAIKGQPAREKRLQKIIDWIVMVKLEQR